MKFLLCRFLGSGAVVLAVIASGLEPARGEDVRVLEVANDVRKQSGKGPWTPAAKGDELKTRDKIRTGARSRATVELRDLFMMRVEQRTIVEFTPALPCARATRAE